MPRKKQWLNFIKSGWNGSEISISYNKIAECQAPISSVIDAHFHVRKIWNGELVNLQEQILALYFDRAGNLIGYRVINSGCMISCPAYVKLIVSLALVSMACSVIIAHNHPSGNLLPSIEDQRLTNRVKKALALIDVDLLDHWIITDRELLSFCEVGLL